MHMQTRGRGPKFVSVIAVVVLALTGFSSGKGHGGSSSSGSSGGGDGSGWGGCSSSSQDHDTSSSSSGGATSGLGKSDDDDDYGDSYSDEPSAEALQDAHVKLISCATVKAPYATVEVRNPNTIDAAFDVAVLFEEAGGTKSMGKVVSIEVPAKDKATAKIEVDDLRRLKLIDHCEVEENAPPS